MVLVAAIFALALSANGLVWLRLTHRLEDTLATRTEACIPMSSLNWIRRTALNHWAISTYSLVLQGRHPTKIILPDEECAAAQTDGLSVTDWYTRPWGEGWFDLTALDQRLARSTSGS